MAGTRQISVDRIDPTTIVVRRPAVRGMRLRSAFVTAIAVAMLGAASFGIFSLAQNIASQTDGEAAGVRAAEASAARLNAQAEYYAAGGATPVQADPGSRPEAIEAYGRRWEALAPSISPAALEAYGARWTALGDRPTGGPISQDAIDAYGARWSALGESARPSMSPEAIDAYGARWAALASTEQAG